MRRAWWWILGAALLAALVTLGAAPALGLARAPVVATVLPARNAWTLLAAALGAALLIAAASRRLRRAALPLGLALVLGAAASAPVVLQRGVTDRADRTPAAGDIRILSWNVNGSLVGPAALAAVAARNGADIVVLPESATSIYGDLLVPAFAAAGLDMTELPEGQPGTTATLVLARADLGPWRLAAARSPEADRSVVALPLEQGRPRIVALHAVIPTPRSTPAWAADLRWAAAQCDADTVIVGDFNTTVDGFGAPRLGGCTDAATAAGTASVGTWPTGLPTWIGMPIDHVLVGARWRVRSFTVLTDEDGSGARHRPVLAVIAER